MFVVFVKLGSLGPHFQGDALGSPLGDGGGLLKFPPGASASGVPLEGRVLLLKTKDQKTTHLV